MRERVLELNASDERGISVVRDKVRAIFLFLNETLSQKVSLLSDTVDPTVAQIKTFASTTNAAKSHDGQACPRKGNRRAPLSGR